MPRGRKRDISLADVGEFGFLRDLLPELQGGRDVLVGPGDDAAIVRGGGAALVMTTDALVAGTHYRSGWCTPGELGRRAFLVNLSDIAAMGAKPKWCLASVGAPARLAAQDLQSVLMALHDAAAEHGTALVGGNLTRAARAFYAVTLIGEATARPITRAGAQVGDRIFVSGELGGAACAVACLRRGEAPAPALRERYLDPPPRLAVATALAEREIASAMIDVSDGLEQDLGHISEASGVAAEIDFDRVPVGAAVRRHRRWRSYALRGGEDYELLFTVPPEEVPQVRRIAKAAQCPLTEIGEIRKGRGVLVSGAGRGLRKGFDHFD